jgi:hypothetical protein
LPVGLRKNVMQVTNTATIFAFRCERCSTELRFERLTGINNRSYSSSS